MRVSKTFERDDKIDMDLQFSIEAFLTFGIGVILAFFHSVGNLDLGI